MSPGANEAHERGDVDLAELGHVVAGGVEQVLEPREVDVVLGHGDDRRGRAIQRLGRRSLEDERAVVDLVPATPNFFVLSTSVVARATVGRLAYRSRPVGSGS